MQSGAASKWVVLDGVACVGQACKTVRQDKPSKKNKKKKTWTQPPLSHTVNECLVCFFVSEVCFFKFSLGS